jgi:hypothetical protein
MSSPARSSLALTARIRATAPKVSLRVLGKADTNVDELRRGNVDIQLTDQTAHPADVRSMTRMTDTVVTVARAHLDVDPTTIEGFATLPHVVISRRGRRRGRIDDNQLGPSLRSFELPVPTPEIPAVMAWRTRHERDTTHRWLPRVACSAQCPRRRSRRSQDTCRVGSTRTASSKTPVGAGPMPIRTIWSASTVEQLDAASDRQCRR